MKIWFIKNPLWKRYEYLEKHFRGKKILDMGCGNKKMKGSIGIDIKTNTMADIHHDLNQFPYPFKDNEFDLIICRHIIEHLKDTVRVMEEIYRIGKPNALVVIEYPHFSCRDAYMDPGHIRYFSYKTFDGLHVGNTRSNSKFQALRKIIIFGRGIKKLLGIEYFANRFPDIYEGHFAFIIPAQYVYVELKIIK